jgi:cysteine desulfurase
VTTIYLDHAATTPVDPRVAAAMIECLTGPEAQANPASSTHGAGLAAQQRVEDARAQIAALVGADPREIIFTSGATEANNLALLGVARAALRGGQAGRAGARVHLVSARTEHKSVLDALRQLEREGFAVTLVEPDETGRVPHEAIETALRPDTLLVSVMLANNETGVVSDVAQIARLARERGVLMHSDASQAVGKIPVDVRELGVDFLSFTAHKFYGPKGIGALYVREGSRPRIGAVTFGGGHERGLRSGTLPTHQVVGFAAAAALARTQGAADAAHARDLAQRLARELESIPGVSFNHRTDGVPGLLNVSFEGVEGESLVTGLPEIAVSTGSACSSATREPSYVLRALGRSTELAQSSLRISLGRFSSAADIDVAATAIRGEVLRLRVLAGGEAIEGAGGRVIGPDSSLATGNTLLGRMLNPLARRYFLARPRILEFPEGSAPDDVRRGRAGRRTDGTEVCFELRIARGTVKSARFSAYGCPHTVAVCAWLCEVLEGAPLAAGAPGDPASWADKFAVPAEKLGRLLIVEDALRAALGYARQD